jgi:hypothetical protein
MILTLQSNPGLRNGTLPPLSLILQELHCQEEEVPTDADPLTHMETDHTTLITPTPLTTEALEGRPKLT